MDRRFSVQANFSNDKRDDDDDERGERNYAARSRISVIPKTGKIPNLMNRMNLAPDHITTGTRCSWDESMRRRDSDSGLKGISLRKGFSEESKNYSLLNTERHRSSRPHSSYFFSSKHLSKWETVNLLGTKERLPTGDEASTIAQKTNENIESRLGCQILSYEPCKDGNSSPVTSSNSSLITKTFSPDSLEKVAESDEQSETETKVPVIRSELGSWPAEQASLDRKCYSELERSSCSDPNNSNAKEKSRYDRAFEKNCNKKIAFENDKAEQCSIANQSCHETAANDNTGNTTGTSPLSGRGGPDERRPSIIPTLNIIQEQSNFEKFINIISTHEEEDQTEDSGESGISRARSCETFHKNDKENMSIWERRRRAARDFYPGTRPIILKIESIDDLAFWSRSLSNTIVEICSHTETYICKDDFHVDKGNKTNAEGRGGSGGEGSGRSSSKLRKPTNLWGVTRRISVKRKKTVKEEKKEGVPQDTPEQR